MRRQVLSRSILGFALTLGLSVAGMAQDQTTPANSTQSTPQSNPSTTTSNNTSSTTSTDTTTRSKSSSKGAMDTGDKSMLGDHDKQFLTKAAEGGLMEVQLAQVAQRQAGSEEVKNYAKQLEQDHTNANKQLTDIASQRGVSLPTTPTAAKMQADVDKLSKLSGSQFDKEYIKFMVRDHKKDIKDFEKESSDGMDSSLKNFASSTLPTLKNHLQMAEQIEKGGSMKTASTASEGTRARTEKNGTVVEKDKTTINKITPAPHEESSTQSNQSTTTNSDGSTSQSSTTVNKVDSK